MEFFLYMFISFFMFTSDFRISAATDNYSPSTDSYCDLYGVCGPNGNCDLRKSPACVCLNGFIPKSSNDWELMDYAQGCVRIKPLNCPTDGFSRFDVFKMPDGIFSWFKQSLEEKDCREGCLRNCSCVAYTTNGGCRLFFGDLFDVRVVIEGGQVVYIRMAASELVTGEVNHGRERETAEVIVGSAIALILGMLLVSGLYYIHRRKMNSKENTSTGGSIAYIKDVKKEDLELPLLELSRIAIATDNFSITKKLGEGGFGPVYKGTLDHGQEIAVKRLSSSSGQGINEFLNEVKLIAKVQHRNLVKLLGCCIQDEEKLLIYEYMPNKSLDFFLFDQTRRKLLDWPMRFNIICGIARGLLYLHHDSRLRIIHRDLKASNILLDNNMNPKISDFGLARTFGGDQSKGKTKRVVGTHGYMAPEYAINGNFSVKSDVFSFGILLLEIVTGKKNRTIICSNDNISLIGLAWDLWRQKRPLELIDECLEHSCTLSEALRCIHISLLCVQQHPKDRPTMSSVVLMLGSEDTLPEPKIPSFFMGESSECRISSPCTNELSITVLDAR